MPLKRLSVLGGLGLADVHHADLQVLIGLGVVHQVVQAAPGAFQLLEIGVVHDGVDLLGELLVDLGDHGLDRHQHVAADELAADSACCASVWMACSTADLASSLLGLNSLFRSEAKSLPWKVTPCRADADWELWSAMAV
jgi:hypothetical protein